MIVLIYKILLIALIWVYICDLSGIVAEIRHGLAKLLKIHERVKMLLLVVSLVVTCIVRSVCVFVTPAVSFTSRTIVLCVLHEIAKKHAKNAK